MQLRDLLTRVRDLPEETCVLLGDEPLADVELRFCTGPVCQVCGKPQQDKHTHLVAVLNG